MTMSHATPSKAILITGCSSGIGKATALRLARAGHAVYATARRPDFLNELTAAGCKALALDVNDEASMRQAVAEVERTHGAIDVLVNNAGYGQSGAVEEIPLDRVRQQFETNVFGLIRLTQLVLPAMRRQGWGRIVNIGSMGGILTFPGGGVYHATKYALEALSDALRFEVGGFGIAVSLIQPGLIRTEFSGTAVGSMGELGGESSPYDGLNRAVARLTEESYHKGPLSWLAGDPDDVAKVVQRAVEARSPRPRYKVTGSAHLLMRLRRLVPDTLWDSFLSTNYPRPGLPR